MVPETAGGESTTAPIPAMQLEYAADYGDVFRPVFRGIGVLMVVMGVLSLPLMAYGVYYNSQRAGWLWGFWTLQLTAVAMAIFQIIVGIVAAMSNGNLRWLWVWAWCCLVYSGCIFVYYAFYLYSAGRNIRAGAPNGAITYSIVYYFSHMLIQMAAPIITLIVYGHWKRSVSSFK
jgi:hypothetical protein